MQALIIPQIGRFINNKTLFTHNVMGEVTGLLLVTVHTPLTMAFTISDIKKGKKVNNKLY